MIVTFETSSIRHVHHNRCPVGIMVPFGAAGTDSAACHGTASHPIIPSWVVHGCSWQADDDLLDLGWIENDDDHRYPGSAQGSGRHVNPVDLGQQPCPCLPAGERAEFLILRGFRGLGSVSGLSSIAVLGRTTAECGPVLPGSTTAGGIQPITARQVPAHAKDGLQPGVPSQRWLEKVA